MLSVPGMLSDVLAGGAWSQVCAGLDVALGAQFCQKKKPFMGREQGWVKVELCGLSSRASLGGAKKLKC